MASDLQEKKIAFLVAQEGVEEVELTKPWQAVKDAGGAPELLAPEEGEIQAFNHLDKSSAYPVDKALENAKADDYDGLVLPGATGAAKHAPPESATSAAQHLAASAQRSPTPFAAGALAAGLLLGWLLGYRRRTS